MKRRYKFLIGTGAVLGLSGAALLFTLGALARSRGVSRTTLPPGRLIAEFARAADYVDSYSASVPPTLFPDARALDRFAFQRGLVAGSSEDEIMYTGESPGLTYHISYTRYRVGADVYLVVTTTVNYRSWRGWLYFAFVRPVHRVLAPFMVSVMIRKARAEA